MMAEPQKIWRVNWRWANRALVIAPTAVQAIRVYESWEGSTPVEQLKVITRDRESVKALGPLRHARWPSEADEKRSSLQGKRLDEDKAK